MTKHVTFMSIDDVDHWTPEEKAAKVAAYPEHEREARARGIPVFGQGRVFPNLSEESIRVDPITIPAHWVRINGLDFGWDHPFGAAGCAWDRDADVFYVCQEYREKETTPVIHAAAVKPWGEWIPCAWPHDGLQHDKKSGETLADSYRGQGLLMTEERATFPDGGNGVEAGVIEMLDRMKTGRWKVFSTCVKWFAEFRLYHRDEGKIVKKQDDLISASRYAYMMRRYAVTKPDNTPLRRSTKGYG